MLHTDPEKQENMPEEQSVQDVPPFTVPPGINFKCPRCAGAVRYSITHGKMICERCDGQFPVSAFSDPSESKRESENARIETMEYRCPSCGASLHTTQTATTGFCSFCGSDVVLEERISSIRRPAKIVPFSVTRRECEEMYLNRLKESRLVPAEMKAAEAVGHFRPIYIPFWRFSGKGEGPCTGTYDTVKVSGSFVYSDTYTADLNGKVSVSDILYDASSQFDDEVAQELRISCDKAVPFHPAYLSGFYAESPDVESRYVSGLARDGAAEGLGKALKAEKKSVSAVATLPETFEEKAELVLLPVWLLASRQGGRVIYSAVNGNRNDDRVIRSELPVSPKRFTVMTLALAAAITLLILLLRHFVLLRPQITAALSFLLAAVCWNSIGPFLARVNLRRKVGDPTRNMLEAPEQTRDVSRFSAAWAAADETRKFAIHPKVFLPFAPPLAILLLIFLISITRNPLRGINSLFADESALPPILCFVSFVLMMIIMFKSRRMGAIGWISMIIQLHLCFFAVFLGNGAAVKPVYYTFALISFVITLLALLNAFRLHNVYVSRPSPLFDSGEDERK